jgi:dienelactone hydrolase
LTDVEATLSEFTASEVGLDGVTKTVYRAGTGPAEILMPEMPGISPDVVRLAGWIHDAGFTVYVPSLFGTDRAYPTTALGETLVRRACVSAELRAFAGGRTSPIVHWLRGLARIAHRSADLARPGRRFIDLSRRCAPARREAGRSPRRWPEPAS